MATIPLKSVLDLLVAQGVSAPSILDQLMASSPEVLGEVRAWMAARCPAPASDALVAVQEYEDTAPAPPPKKRPAPRNSPGPMPADSDEETEDEGPAGGARAKKARFKWESFVKDLALPVGHPLRFRARDLAKAEHTRICPLVSFKDKLLILYSEADPAGPTPVAASIKKEIGNFRPDSMHVKKGIDVPASGHKDWELQHQGKWYRLADPIWAGLIWSPESASFVARA